MSNLIPSDKYVEECGLRCPAKKCGGVTHIIEVEERGPAQLVRHCFCEFCGLEWDEIFRMTRYEINSDGK